MSEETNSQDEEVLNENTENTGETTVQEESTSVDDVAFTPAAEELTDKDHLVRLYVNGRYIRSFTLAEGDELTKAVARQRSLNNTTDSVRQYPGDTADELDLLVRKKHNITDTGA